jgi:WD40 repeat protein
VSLDSFIGVWDADRKEKIREIATNYPALSAKFLPKNNNLCIVGSATPGVRVFNLSTGNLVKRVKTADCVVSIATDDSGRFVFTAGRDGSLAAFAVHQGGGTVRKVASLNLGSSRGVSFIAWQEGKFEEDHPRSEAVAAAWSISGSSSMLTDFIAASVRGAVLLVTFVHSRKYPEIAGSRAESRDGLNVHQLAVMRSIPIPQASMPLRCTFCERPSTAANLCVATGSEDGCVHLVSGNMYRSDISVTLSPGYPCVIVDVAWNASQTILVAGTDTGDVVVWRRLRISGGDAVDAEFQRTVVADHPPQPASSSGSQTDITAVTEQSDHPESSAFTLSAATDLS